MPMTVAITNNAAPRVRGFLASVMVEAAPGVYVGPRLNPGVRRRVLDVLEEWQLNLGGAITVVWLDVAVPGGLAVRTFGSGARELCELDGLFLSRTPLDGDELVKLGLRPRSLKTKDMVKEHPFVPGRGRPPAPELSRDGAPDGEGGQGGKGE